MQSACAKSLLCAVRVLPERSANKANKRRIESMLPEEMETEVLLRLPVKSILRFSAVCRRWEALLDLLRGVQAATTSLMRPRGHGPVSWPGRQAGPFSV